MPKPDDVGVGTAMIILDAWGRVLLGMRQGAHAAGSWAPPGGWLDRSDLLTGAAAARETLEETGMRVTECVEHCWTTEDHADLGVRTVTLYHLATAWTGHPCIMEPNKCAVWAWFELDALPEPLFPGVEDALFKLSQEM